jgi:hypothetical protein
MVRHVVLRGHRRDRDFQHHRAPSQTHIPCRQETLGRLIAFVQWPVWSAAIWVAMGLVRNETAWALVLRALEAIGGGLAGKTTYLIVTATSRTYRILRDRRNSAIP